MQPQKVSIWCDLSPGGLIPNETNQPVTVNCGRKRVNRLFTDRLGKSELRPYVVLKSASHLPHSCFAWQCRGGDAD